MGLAAAQLEEVTVDQLLGGCSGAGYSSLTSGREGGKGVMYSAIPMAGFGCVCVALRLL